MSEVIIRDMLETDFDQMMKIYEQSLEKGDVTFQTVQPTYADWDNGHIKECRYVAELNGKVVGYTMIAPTSKREAYKGVVELSIFVDKGVLHQGIGFKLLNHLVKETEQKGYWTLYSAIFSVNTASIDLHKKCGFRVVGYREKIAKDIFGDWADTTIMERRSSFIL